MTKQLKVFIVNPDSQNTIRKTCELYVEVFNGPPWYEDWTLDDALKEYQSGKSKSNFTSAMVYDELSEIAGFAWGFNMPANSSENVDYVSILEQLKERDSFDADKTFYIAEVGVGERFRKKGIGQTLVQKIADLNPEANGFAFRTKNLAMLNLGVRVLGDPIIELSEESAYEGGKLYYFQRQIK